VLSEYAYGATKGCFEKPSNDVPPNSGISCPDITPIELSAEPVNKQAMRNPSQLVHPDVPTPMRYVSGTRFVFLI
jgi:hypothetical protein